MLDPKLIEKAVELVQRRGVNRQYFFDNLKSPDWIVPLREAGFFKSPPEPEQEGSYITYQLWPDSRYLARMASKRPDLVLETILKIPTSNNARVYDDYAEAALLMPPNLSAKLVPVFLDFLKAKKHMMLLPDKLTKLIIHLSNGGEGTSAIQLAEILFDVDIDRKKDTHTWHDIRSAYLFNEWHYREWMGKVVRVLAAHLADPTFDLFCRILRKAITLLAEVKGDRSSEDISYIWRPAIEDNKENHDRGVEGALISAVRDAGTVAVTSGKSSLPTLLRRLSSEESSVFKRIALHLIRQSKPLDSGILEPYLLNEELFDAYWARHEYSLLAKEGFHLLAVNKREPFFSWVERGPLYVREGMPHSDKERYIEFWKREKLGWVRSALTDKWANTYKELVSKYGEPEEPGALAVSSAVWTGPNSPKTQDELEAMTPDQLLGFLKTWVPPNEEMSDSREGLSRCITSLIEKKSNVFSSIADKFVSIDPTYVRGVIQGFSNAVKNGQSIDWKPVVSLCDWVISQEREISGRTTRVGHLDSDPDWSWTRKTIARLFIEGFNTERAGTLDFSLRATTWKILSVLLNDPDPTPEDEAEEADRFDPATSSINSVRGEALHTLVRYSLWVRHHLLKKEGASVSFNDIPEAKEAFEQHLNITNDPSLAIRSVYGQWFPWITMIDDRWARQHAATIFPSDTALKNYRAAAWETYLWACPVYDNAYEILKDIYAVAVEQIGHQVFTKTIGAETDTNLAEHLMTLAWRGKVAPNELSKFWKSAPIKLRKHAIDFVGRALNQTPGEVPPEILERIKKLWEQRLTYTESQIKSGIKFEELEGFGFWFASSKFPLDWSLAQLVKAVRYTGKMTSDHLVIERLVTVFKDAPNMTLEALAELIKIDVDHWIVVGSKDQINAILTDALKHSDPSIHQSAREIVNLLGAQGYLEFGKLLKG